MKTGRVKDEGDDQPLSIEGIKDQLATGAKILARGVVNEAARRNPGLAAFGLALGSTVALVRRMRSGEQLDLVEEARRGPWEAGMAAGENARKAKKEGKR
jgi:hypothetical protein